MGQVYAEAQVAYWVLTCLECDSTFPHTDLSTLSPSLRDDPFLTGAPKREFPSEGIELECPNCNKSSVYFRHQLFYRAR